MIGTTRNLPGVVVSSPEEQSSATPKHVYGLFGVELFAVDLGDEDGKRRRTLVFKMGDGFWVDPQGEEWAKRLLPIQPNSWLGKTLKSRLGVREKPRDVVPSDTVDVMNTLEEK